VERRVEDRDLRLSRAEELAAGPDAPKVVRVVEWRELDARLDPGLDVGVDENRILESLAAVHDSVADRVDREAAEVFLDPRERRADRLAVRRELARLGARGRAAHLDLPEGARETDALDGRAREPLVARRPDPLAARCDDLELHGGGAAVEYENVHRASIPRASSKIPRSGLQ
jgi:hypothetical protein